MYRDESGAPRRAGLHQHRLPWSAVFSPDGRTLATGGGDRVARLWDLRDRRRSAELATLTGHVGTVVSVAISPSGHALATTSYDKTIRLKDLSRLAFVPHTDWPTSA